ncbi:flagellar biosynthesis anti-sigma factor FlgM [Sporolactobacillus spathodeae]|uniref:Negative regulator of flagellin synthesis n=1 Tax=Sporolactobacillus spathodeae TaxID=1465502 RepID=A0ABS2Q658_9BACL|nr:flagellar biosynthesis anti-sigma factor FlgM [Sporolactobacillus spathodeae]MBM7657262.1 negative regulator of flagellin synthesis FlgM [Sporolactobacillus spathodeae]
MKIDRYQPIQQTYGMYNSHKSTESQSKAASHTNDKVEISAEARHMQEVGKMDETRSNKVEQLKAQVQSGDYHVDAKSIAAKMYAYWNK